MPKANHIAILFGPFQFVIHITIIFSYLFTFTYVVIVLSYICLRVKVRGRECVCVFESLNIIVSATLGEDYRWSSNLNLFRSSSATYFKCFGATKILKYEKIKINWRFVYIPNKCLNLQKAWKGMMCPLRQIKFNHERHLKIPHVTYIWSKY